MNFTNPIVITTINGDAEVIRIYPKSTVAEVMWEVEAAIIDMYERSDIVFEEFVECGELQIDGLPMNLQVELFCKLKEEIDGDEIYIESTCPARAFPTMKLKDYLEHGTTNDPEEKKED